MDSTSGGLLDAESTIPPVCNSVRVTGCGKGVHTSTPRASYRFLMGLYGGASTSYAQSPSSPGRLTTMAALWGWQLSSIKTKAGPTAAFNLTQWGSSTSFQYRTAVTEHRRNIYSSVNALATA